MGQYDFSRRRFLEFGSAAIAALSGGSVWLEGCSESPRGAAYSPWSSWNDRAIAGSSLALVAAGILAANPHDTQPWLFRIGPSTIQVFADTARHLGAMDPMLREMHIGLGCALENMVLAGRPNGFAATIEMDGGDLRSLSERRRAVSVATVHLAPAGSDHSPSASYSVIAQRHTNRNAYDRGRPLPPHWRSAAASIVDSAQVRLFAFEGGASRQVFDQIILDATAAIIADTRMIGDSDRWLRRTDAEIETFRSGPTLEAAGLSPTTLMMAKTFQVSTSMEHAAWLTHTRDDQLATAPLTGLIAVRDKFDRAQALAAGMAWQRLHLDATVTGVALQPLNQAMEMADRDFQVGRVREWDKRLEALVGGDGWRPTFAFRAGWAERPAPASPRRALRDVLMA